MNKTQTLAHLRNAKASHVAWVQKAKFLIEGLKVSEDAIPIDATACMFGQWFYGEAQKLNSISTNPMECMSEVEKLHIKLHDTYLNIYKIFFDTSEMSFFSKLMGKQKKISPDAKELAKNYFKELEEISGKLVDEINRLERRMLAIQEVEFEKL